MTPVTPTRTDEIRRRQRRTTEIRDTLRELASNLRCSTITSAHASTQGRRPRLPEPHRSSRSTQPERPRTTRRAAPATITGILDRLERGGWVARERDPSDRRAVLVRALPDRNADLMRLYSGMSASMNKLLAAYADPRTRTDRRFPPPHRKRRPKRSRRTSRRLTQEHRSKPHSPAPARCPPPASALGASARSIADP